MYQQLQKQVFNWLKDKYNQDKRFTFSVRQKANKGAELNYFIGTEKSSYFSMTFWNVPVSYPGSSGDLINLVFTIEKNQRIRFHFQFNQTKNPPNNQNTYALEFIRSIKPLFKEIFPDGFYSPDTNKMEFFAAYSPPIYDDFEGLKNDLEVFLGKILPIVDQQISILKAKYPEFTANRFTQEEQELMLKKMEDRFAKYKVIGELTEDLEEEEELINLYSNFNAKHPLNQILYGPPGTGKTYHTINKALAIIENKSEDELAQEAREALKNRYQDYVDKGRIVFTTFHQSMSYEDFVEGIKPQTVNEKVVYEVEPGIFKATCDRARGAKGNFDEVLEKFKIDVNQGVRAEPLTIKSKSTYFDIEYRGTNVFYVQPHNSSKENPWYPVNIENIRKVFETGTYDNVYNSTYVREVISYWERTYKLKKNIGVSVEPYVLIIDEINRGNVSAIFGELITLIEESKRAGASEALELTLPYSKEKFSVPNNLFIIGTMNTADRSVEALDTALRRRFAFEEMMPKPSKITNDGALAASAGILDGIDLAAVLRKINQRIEVLLDIDHQIGHSYLINVADRYGLANAFNNCIIPLLKEYFYHEDEKIALVLGSGFVSIKKQVANVHSLFPVMEGLEVHSINSKNRFNLLAIDENNIITALQTLLAGG